MPKVSPPLTQSLGWPENDEPEPPKSFFSQSDTLWTRAVAPKVEAMEKEQEETLKRTQSVYELAIRQLELEQQSVLNGTHDEFQYRREQLKRKRDENISASELHLINSKQCVHTMATHEQYQNSKLFATTLDKIKDDILINLEKEQRKLENRRSGVQDDERVATRSLRSKAKPDEEKDEAPRPPSSYGRRGRKATSPASILLDRVALDDDEIRKDKYDIERETQKMRAAESSPTPLAGKRKAQAEKGSNVQANARIGQLTFNEETFEKGDVVTVDLHPEPSSSAPSSQISGHIQSVNNTEVHVKLPDGRKHRVYLSHLRNGRAVIHHSD